MSDPCSICDSPETKVLTPFESALHRVVHCGDCGHEVIRPSPTQEDLQSFYSGYYATQTPEAELRFLFEQSKKFFDAFLAHARLADLEKRNFLEVGFGNGASLFAAADAGFRAFGLDVDGPGVARAMQAARHFGVNVECGVGDIRGFRKDLVLHVVKASQVIEHIPDPGGFLAEIASRQPQGGCLILDFPNNEAAFWLVKNRLRQRYQRTDFYNALKIGEHLSGFTRRSIAVLLRDAGYSIDRCSDYSRRHPFLQPQNLLWYPSLGTGIRNSLRDRAAYPVQKSLIGVLDEVASRVAGRGTGLSIWATRN